jgi:hypothetical protein
MVLRLGGYDDQWRVRESCAGELVSERYGPCADVKSVALDPLPGMFEDGTVVLVRGERERFLRRLLGRR